MPGKEADDVINVTILTQRVTYLVESLHLYMLGCRVLFIVIIHQSEEVKTLPLTTNSAQWPHHGAR